MYEHLLAPGNIGGMVTRNRFVMSGMGVNRTGHFSEDSAAWYGARAKGGYGLIVTEFNAVNKVGSASPTEVIVTKEELPNYQKTVEEVHQYPGAKIFLQLHHAGRESTAFLDGEIPVAPSAVPSTSMKQIVHAMTTQEVYETIEDFAKAAEIAKLAGFDGVECHFGHGYLGSQFMSMYLNKRVDEFGGNIVNRARFATEVIKAIKNQCGVDFPVSIRISGDEYVPYGRVTEETAMFCNLMEQAGADAFNVSLGTYASMQEMMPTAYKRPAFNTTASEIIKKAVKVPVMSVGRMNDPGVMDEVIANGLCDFAITGRASIADPEFPNKVKEGRLDEISPCIGCLSRCNSAEVMEDLDPGVGRVSCAFNPFSGFERERKIVKSNNPKKVVVIGAGVGGMEAAWVSAACGHHVTLLEKSSILGGQANIAMMPPHKSEIAKVIAYYTTMCKKYGVDVQLNTEATKESVLALKPDVVIVATGGTPINPPFENDGISVVQAWDVLTGKVIAGDNVLIVGGGQVGLETGEFLGSQMRHCDVVEMADHCTYDVHPNNEYFMRKHLDEFGVKRLVSHKVKKFTKDGAICQTPDGEVTLSGYDQIVLALGSRPCNALKDALENEVRELYVIGDAGTHGGALRRAVDQAVRIALKL
jgi:2,4-dienoyl-CoA reductase-like NADH-dependent reductase (Old Yellow Enzyme family)/thioredoxin reductase